MAPGSADGFVVSTERLGWPPPRRGWRRCVPWETQTQMVYDDRSDEPTARVTYSVTNSRRRCAGMRRRCWLQSLARRVGRTCILRCGAQNAPTPQGSRRRTRLAGAIAISGTRPGRCRYIFRNRRVCRAISPRIDRYRPTGGAPDAAHRSMPMSSERAATWTSRNQRRFCPWPRASSTPTAGPSTTASSARSPPLMPAARRPPDVSQGHSEKCP